MRFQLIDINERLRRSLHRFELESDKMRTLQFMAVYTDVFKPRFEAKQYDLGLKTSW